MPTLTQAAEGSCSPDELATAIVTKFLSLSTLHDSMNHSIRGARARLTELRAGFKTVLVLSSS